MAIDTFGYALRGLGFGNEAIVVTMYLIGVVSIECLTSILVRD